MSILVIIIIAITAYFLFFSGEPDISGQALLESSQSGELVGAQVLSLLQQIQSLNIDTTFLNSGVFQSLVDYSVAIPADNVGRSNPFAPI